jgi:DUF1365 family protein
MPAPGGRLVAQMNTLQAGRSCFDATLRLERRPWNATSLHSALLRFPWMTAQVIGAIHWEALQLYFKKLKVFTHPANS